MLDKDGAGIKGIAVFVESNGDNGVNAGFGKRDLDDCALNFLFLIGNINEFADSKHALGSTGADSGSLVADLGGGKLTGYSHDTDLGDINTGIYIHGADTIIGVV